MYAFQHITPAAVCAHRGMKNFALRNRATAVTYKYKYITVGKTVPSAHVSLIYPDVSRQLPNKSFRMWQTARSFAVVAVALILFTAVV